MCKWIPPALLPIPRSAETRWPLSQVRARTGPTRALFPSAAVDSRGGYAAGGTPRVERKLAAIGLRPCSPFSSRRPCYSAVPNNVGAVSGATSDNTLALGLIIVGAVALAISTFLPLVEPTGTFRMVEHNTLIQRGGWLLIALALGIAVSGYRVSQGRWTARWVPIALCVSAAALIVLNDKNLRTTKVIF